MNFHHTTVTTRVLSMLVSFENVGNELAVYSESI